MSRNFDPQIGLGTRWKKGQASPNPGGRPKKNLLTDAYREVLGRRFPGDERRRTYAQVIAEKMAAEAARGNVRAALELADRTEGKTGHFPQIVTEAEDTCLESLSEEELIQELGQTRDEIERILVENGWPRSDAMGDASSGDSLSKQGQVFRAPG